MKLQQAIEIWDLQIPNFTTLTDYQVEVVAIASDADPEDVYEYSAQRLRQQFALISRTLNNIPSPPDTIRLLGEDLHLIPFHHLTLGEFIDLEHFCAENSLIMEVCAILYRRKTVSPWQGDTWEEYGEWLGARKKLFADAELATAGAKIQYLQWRSNVTTQYSGLFETPYDEDPQDQEILSTLEREKLKRQENQQRAFSWEGTLLTLANGNAAYVPQVLKLPVLLALNLLSSLKIHTKL
jgi:hypothetical protein